MSSLPSKAENDALTEADLAALRSLKNPFYAEACEAIQAKVRGELAALEGKVKIEETPDVAPDKLFDAIVAPYKGKVVLGRFLEHLVRTLARRRSKTTSQAQKRRTEIGRPRVDLHRQRNLAAGRL